MAAPIPRRSYAEFTRRLNEATARSHVPVSGSIELTYRCNFECVHCYEQDMREQRELSGDRWCEIIDEAASMGCLWLTLTGGEAILHRDFEQIYSHAIRRGMLVTLFSNGSTLSEKTVKLLERMPPRSIEVTLYGFSPQTYLHSTGRARNFEQAVEGVKRVVAAGFKPQIKTVVFRETVGDFEAIRAFAQELGLDFRFDTEVHATLKGGTQPLQHRLKPEEIVALDLNEGAKLDATRAKIGTPEAQASSAVYRCSAGRNAFNIAPDGHLQLCTLVRSLRFDLSLVSFRSAWEALGGEVQRRYAATNRRCNGCELRFMCGTCPGIAELEKGDPEAAIDHVCETTHLRASQVFGRPFIPRWKQAANTAPSAPAAKLPVLGQEENHGRAQTSCGSGACAGCKPTSL